MPVPGHQQEDNEAALRSARPPTAPPPQADGAPAEDIALTMTAGAEVARDGTAPSKSTNGAPRWSGCARKGSTPTRTCACPIAR